MAIRLVGSMIFGGILMLAYSTSTFATSNPIPGVDIIVKKNPGGGTIRVGDCRATGGKIVKQGKEWVCNVAKPKAR